jgi:hypothetical protein
MLQQRLSYMKYWNREYLYWFWRANANKKNQKNNKHENSVIFCIVLEQFNLDKKNYISFELKIQRIKKFELQTLINLQKITDEVVNDKVLFFSIGKPTCFF